MGMRDLQGMIDSVKHGRLSRRGFIGRMAAVGLTAPMATQLLAMGGVAMAQPTSSYKPTRRGGGGTLKLLWWQGPTLLNPHFAVGTKDQDASYLFYEPLAVWDADANLTPKLAAEIPSRANGGLAADGKSVVWKLKPGVQWHDGQPFTADDVVFNWKFASDPATAAVTSGIYNNIKVEKIDDHTVRVVFDKPTPFWANPFVGAYGMLIPKHVFEPYIGAKSRQAPANLAPVGTGAYKFKEFHPGDLVAGVINTGYHEPNRPYFDAVEMKGGGEAASAARAVLQTGEYDYAWNLQVEDTVLKQFEAGGKGRIQLTYGSSIEHIQLNSTDPNKMVDGERSSIKTVHPTLSDPAVRQALKMLIDRGSVEKYIYGRTGTTTGNYINGPSQFVSKDTTWEFNIAKAKALLDKAGWKPGSDGIRAKGGKKLKYVFQTSINQPRQQTQEIVKHACAQAGIGIQVKAVLASVYFSSDVGNPDTYTKFYADLQMYTTQPGRPDPGWWMQSFLSDQVATKANKWAGRNITRWRNPQYDKIWHASESELDPVKRAALLIQCNDMVVNDVVVIPVIFRYGVSAVVKNLHASLTGWDNDTSDLADWYKDASA
ncbi:MAG TPA: peptide ABC transporter substrate-binding protein [Acetobacteraceae bacterium]|nr:peptide ABC transporter substrate-binding protein [Acetobacteraceae bacterium]